MITLDRLEVTNFKSVRGLSLAFPKKGAILVEGRNESGKSTLFEAIYFGLYGSPLISEDNRRSLESLISYGEDAASVRLSLRSGDRHLTISRAARRNRPSTASLEIATPTGETERVSGVRAVNARVIEELGGLDGDALLNSCFVEQKKLSKLEDLDAKERRASLLKILNLEKISSLEEEFRPRPSDERRLDRAEKAVRLVEVSRRAEELETEVRARRESAAHERELELRSRLAEARRRLAEAGRRGSALRELHALEAKRAQQELLAQHVPEQAQGRSFPTSGLLLSAALGLAGVGALSLGAALVGAALIVLAALAALLIVARRPSPLHISPADTTSCDTDDGLDSEIAGIRARLGIAPGADLEEEWRSAVREEGSAGREVEHIERELERPEPQGLSLDGEDSPERRLFELHAEARHLSRELGVEATGLDAEECAREYEAARREAEIKQRASVILAETRRRVVERVLPETERNMKLLLPVLTAGRYHDARMTEDYRISVWDVEARRYVAKNVFSGGTQDQFSLALRLAFAIASLPQELGTSPGFIFMDEPLSSFDDERAQALVELITRGELAQIFPQICVISHNRSFDPNAFPYVVHMEGGCVRYTNLQQARRAE